MRLFSLITALFVMAALYVFVFERDRATEFAAQLNAPTDDAPSETTTETPAEPVSEAAPVASEATAKGSVSVVAVKSVGQTVQNGVLVRGRTEAERQVNVRAETGGLVVSQPIRKGSFVETGQLVCEIDPGTRPEVLAETNARLAEAKARLPEANARVAEARARFTEATINDEVASQLSQDGFASETRVAATAAAVSAAEAGIQSAVSGVEAAAAGIQSAEASVAAAMKDIDRLRIKAPFEGLLETDTAELGTLLQPGGLCATIIQLDPIKLVGFVAETEVDKVKVGALAGARLLSGREVQGRVSFLSRAADPNTRTFRVEAEVANTDLSIRDGQTVEIAIAADGVMAHLLPQSAMTLDNAGTIGVRYVTAENEAAFSPVTILRDSVEGIWVTGLDMEVSVIIVGQEFVTDGVPVNVTYREASE
jgi:multidrug efflux system membrane fusion protein